jgi:hypothetical protein
MFDDQNSHLILTPYRTAQRLQKLEQEREKVANTTIMVSIY